MIEETQLTPLEARQQEITQYEQNITMYSTILATLPTEWPEHLLVHRGVKNQHEAAGTVDELADVALLAQLWYADECRNSIRAEIIEMTKAKSISAALATQITP